MNNILYLIQIENDIEKNIFKIGKTTRNIEDRIKEYNEKVLILCYECVYDCHKCEKN